jgi:adenylate cyclase
MNQSNQKQAIEDDLPRKLTAILQVDVVEYCRLMEADETSTLTRLRKHRQELVDPAISDYYGRVVKLMGDGALVEFPSVVEAVVCALKIQAGMVERNKNIPGSQQIKFRIGINLGDVIVEGEDIHGDEVNITARLEALAESEGICISGIVFDAIGNKLPLRYDFVGKQTVKNIAQPLRIYRVQLKAGATLPRPGGLHLKRSKKRLFPVIVGLVASVLIVGTLILFKNRTIELHIVPIESAAYSQFRPAIVMTPFTNMSGDPNQKNFSVGMSEDIFSGLSQLSSLKVMTLGPTYNDKDSSIEARQVGENLGAQYILEGSARKDGKRVHVMVQLVEIQSGRHLWAERYDRELKDIIVLQDDIVEQIVSALPLHPEEDKKRYIGQVRANAFKANNQKA